MEPDPDELRAQIAIAEALRTMPMTDLDLAYLAWWARWRLRTRKLSDDEALALTWESQAELEAILQEHHVERDVNGVEMDGP